jgi:hypothetical protein
MFMSAGAWKQVRIWGHRNLMRLGIDIRKKRPDRRILEQVIFPELLQSSRCQRILFVGCAWYTLHYPAIFADREFITMEISPEESQYGARRHIVDTCEHIDQYFSNDSLDAVILNGVYGFGLNELPAIQRTFLGIYNALSEGGLFILGWNDLPDHAPYSIEQIEKLTPFKPYVFPKLDVAVHKSDSKNRHRFHFYRKESD